MDYYKIVLTELYDFFISIDDDFRAKWIAEVFCDGKMSKIVEHHLMSHKGNMGSVMTDISIILQ